MILAIITEIQSFIRTIMSGLNLDILFYAGVGFELLLAIFFIIKSRYSYEMRMVRKLLTLNNWLNKNRYIDQSNLLEFNNLMKKTPKLLRYHWHQYMLYRDKNPSTFMSTYNLVEKPLKTSSYVANIKNYGGISIAISFFFLFVGIVNLGTAEVTFSYVAQSITTPLIMLILYYIIGMIMRARQNLNTAALFQYTHYFGRFLDRAVTNMPEYVDFEVLFTRQEIKKGIPILNEYLEKRAKQEQEELEKARLNAIEHEDFDFASTGVDGSLVLERAINETETYLNIRNRLLSEIEQLEGEIASSKRTFENTEKDYQKKMQASKENVDRLRKQQEETTNRIENNYIKKQQADEIKKQEQLEKDNDAATMRFNQEMDSLTSEIETRRKELDTRKQYVEDAMKSEYQSFSAKMYKSIYAITEERYQEEKDELIELKEEISDELQTASYKLAEQNRTIEELKKILAKNNIDLNQYGFFHSDSVNSAANHKLENTEEQEQTDEQENVIPLSDIPKSERKYDKDGGFIDANGYYRYDNGAYFTPDGRYFDEKGGWYEANGKVYHPASEKQKKVEPEPVQENKVEEQPTNESANETVSTVNINRKRAEDVPEKDREYGEDGGFYDKEGYYYYENGAYFTPDGRYFDEFGGWYEADGKTYHKPEEQEENKQEENKEPVSLDKLPQPLNAITDQQQQQIKNLKEQFNIEVLDKTNPANKPIPRGVHLDDNGAYFDEAGNYVYPNQGYYDPDGNFHDVAGDFYDVKNVDLGDYQPSVLTEDENYLPEGIKTQEEKPEENAEETTENVENPIEEQETPEQQESASNETVEEQPVENKEVNLPEQEENTEVVNENKPADSDEENGEGNIGSLFNQAQEEENKPEEKPAEQLTDDEKPAKKRGRKAKKVQAQPEQPKEEKRKAGRPRKVEEEQPVGSIEDMFAEEGVTPEDIKKARKKNKKEKKEIDSLDEQIAKENQKLSQNQQELDQQLSETLSQLDNKNEE